MLVGGNLGIAIPIVMRRGKIVEDAETAILFEKPQHAYTRLLRDSIPLPEVSDGWLKEF